MAESVHISKSQKKRQRQSAKKMIAKLNEEKLQKEEEFCKNIDPLTLLKEKLSEAKKAGDGALVKKIRQDIWVLQDTAAGHKPDLPDTEVSQSLQRITSNFVKEDVQTNAEPQNSISPIERKIRNLEKKLKKIEELKEKEAKGQKLEKTQITKIESENSVKEEIVEMQELLGSLSVTR